MLPSPAELTYFFEVAKVLNLSRASKNLGVSQPSLSLAIKRLENTLGTHIFVRHKQGVTLTPAGKKLLAQVKPLLQHWENTKIQARESHQEVQGRVTIGCRSSSSLYMGSFLRNLLEKYPNLEINFKFQNSVKTTESVIRSSVDIGLVVNPLKHHDLILHKFNDVEICCWVGHGKSAMQDIHSNQAVIICEPNIPQIYALLRKIENSNFNIARTVTANNLETIAHFAISGCGIGLLPKCFVTKVYQQQLIRITAMPSYSDEVFLIYRHENKNVEAIKVVIKALKDYSLETQNMLSYQEDI